MHHRYGDLDRPRLLAVLNRNAMGFADTMAARLAGYGPRPCIEFEHTWYTGDDIQRYIALVEDALNRAGVSPAEPVGLVVRNRVAHAAVILGFIAAGRPVSMIYSYQSEHAIAQDIRALRLPAIIADPTDWSGPADSAAQATGSAAVALSPTEPRWNCACARAAALPVTAAEPGLHLLTSGTTGPAETADGAHRGSGAHRC